MRVVVGLVAVLVLVAAVQPASAQCVNRGGSRTCAPDPNRPKDPKSGWQPPPEEPVKTDGQTVVFVPSTSDDGNAWVLTPGNSGDTPGSALACGSGTGC